MNYRVSPFIVLALHLHLVSFLISARLPSLTIDSHMSLHHVIHLHLPVHPHLVTQHTQPDNICNCCIILLPVYLLTLIRRGLIIINHPALILYKFRYYLNPAWRNTCLVDK